MMAKKNEILKTLKNYDDPEFAKKYDPSADDKAGADVKNKKLQRAATAMEPTRAIDLS